VQAVRVEKSCSTRSCLNKARRFDVVTYLGYTPTMKLHVPDLIEEYAEFHAAQFNRDTDMVLYEDIQCILQTQLYDGLSCVLESALCDTQSWTEWPLDNDLE
jgi:hypothetical protein